MKTFYPAGTQDLLQRLTAATQTIEASTALTAMTWMNLAEDLAVASSMCRVLAAGVQDSDSVIETRGKHG